MKAAVRQCIDTFVRDTDTPSEFSDVLAHLAREQPSLMTLYTEQLARRHLLGAPLQQPLLQMLRDYFSVVDDSSVHQFYRNHVTGSQLDGNQGQQPAFEEWPIRMHPR